MALRPRARVAIALLLGAAAARAVPAHHERRLAWLRQAMDAPGIRDPEAAFRAPAAASAPARAPFARGAARELQQCHAPFQIVREGERCTPAIDGQEVKMCQAPLHCLAGMCRRLKEGDPCHTDAQCDGASSNLDMVCVEGTCQHLLEAGEACSSSAQCFSGQCKGDKCVGVKEGDKCRFETPGADKEVVFQNPCDEGLHCALRGMDDDGSQQATCRKATSLGEPCLGYAINFNPEQPLTIPPFFLSAFASSVYAACEPGHVCEVSVFPTREESGHATLSYAGTCRRLLHGPPGTECHSDMVCEPPYSCIGGECGASPAVCGAEATEWAMQEGQEEDAARKAALLHGCATNERCSCPGGKGVCTPVHDECAREEQRLIRCMEDHGCPWVDNGQTQCAEDACRDEDIAFECCKYRDPEFAGNVDWAAMTYMYGRDIQDMCEHIVSGTVRGLPWRGDRVVLELNGKDDQIVSQDGSFSFSTKLPHLTPYNVTVTQQPGDTTCRVTEQGSGVARDDVHGVLVLCGSGRSAGGPRGHGGAVAAAILVPLLLCCGLVGGASAMIGRNMGGTPADGFATLVGAARNASQRLPLPSVHNPFGGRGGGGGGGAADGQYTGFIGAAGGGYDPSAGMEPIPQAQVVDATTGMPVLQASQIQPQPGYAGQ